ncbi:hypothetical protein [Undibacterium terreum]|uniref:Uncharacterized protein n=1 Tax=Undibacterium terreum TaxID=1224302 RepID=A0A916U7F0_9BURK|nr:hypothetical protein [Undibacterium terreum]GGC63435.1 hypothetical protein GCM10011396_07980 [Undibacterium terreum]
MGAKKAISLLLMATCPWAWADKAAPNGPPAPPAPVPDLRSNSALRMDAPRTNVNASMDRSSASISSSPIPSDQPKTGADIPLDSRDGLHMIADGERPALEYKLSETGAMRVRSMRRGAKVVMVWQFK